MEQHLLIIVLLSLQSPVKQLSLLRSVRLRREANGQVTEQRYSEG